MRRCEGRVGMIERRILSILLYFSRQRTQSSTNTSYPCNNKVALEFYPHVLPQLPYRPLTCFTPPLSSNHMLPSRSRICLTGEDGPGSARGILHLIIISNPGPGTCTSSNNSNHGNRHVTGRQSFYWPVTSYEPCCSYSRIRIF